MSEAPLYPFQEFPGVSGFGLKHHVRDSGFGFRVPRLVFRFSAFGVRVSRHANLCSCVCVRERERERGCEREVRELNWCGWFRARDSNLVSGFGVNNLEDRTVAILDGRNVLANPLHHP